VRIEQLLICFCKIEKSKAEELKAQQATAALQDDRALEEEFNRCLDKLAERIRQSPAVQKPPADVPEPGGTCIDRGIRSSRASDA
jgi:benzoyl-CoA reductase/2-hydroxyglutaryl-CoA dehydratase subunit BcrC/BadD/HgdB